PAQEDHPDGHPRPQGRRPCQPPAGDGQGQPGRTSPRTGIRGQVMKYVPLVWAAVMRKPTRAVLTLLSVMLAFTLFGLTIGMNATFDKVYQEARTDRIFTGSRFGGSTSRALAGQIEKMPGVALVTANGFIAGYHQDPKDRAFVVMEDDQAGKVMTEWPITPAQ